MTLLDSFIETCRAAVARQNTEGSALADITDATRRLVADPAELQRIAPDLSGGDAVMGRVETLYADAELTVMVMTTPPGWSQPPHDHEMAAVIGVYAGGEVHRLYTADGDRTEATPSGRRTVSIGETLTLGPDAIHAIAADGDVVCHGIHTYLGNLETVQRRLFHPDSLRAEPFDEDRYRSFCRSLDPASA